MKITLILLVAGMISTAAHADYPMATSGSAIICYGEDNMSFTLNAKRSTVKFTVEGESLGPKKITKTDSDNQTYVSYTTSEGTLTLSNNGDTYQFADDDSEDAVFPVDCEKRK